MALIIVESPEKAKVIEGYFQGELKVVATKGHLLDLPYNKYGLIKDGGEFTMEETFVQGADKTIAYIKDAVQNNNDNEIYIATDDDREGEKIAYDLVKLLKLKQYKRVTFSEISERAVKESLANPRKISEAMLAERHGRRGIDRTVGYGGTNIIKKEFTKLGIEGLMFGDGKGIGRSIAPALKLLCDTEENIEEFIDNPPEKLELIRANLVVDGVNFVAKHDKGFTLNRHYELQEMINLFARNKMVVTDYQPKTYTKQPPKPLTTSSYQYGMFYLYGIEQKEAMQIAQKLYWLGFISYPRTDSFRVPEERANEFIGLVYGEYGEEYCAEDIRMYNKEVNKGTQNAHPAILPTKTIPNTTQTLFLIFGAMTLVLKHYVKNQLFCRQLIKPNTYSPFCFEDSKVYLSTTKLYGFL